jgi:hypothetical protein
LSSSLQEGMKSVDRAVEMMYCVSACICDVEVIEWEQAKIKSFSTWPCSASVRSCSEEKREGD